MLCRNILFISLLAIYLTVYFQFLNTKQGRIFVYTIYGDEEAIDKIRVEKRDKEISLLLGAGLVVVGFLLITYTSATVCRAS
jgi:hypothetical protein